MSEEKAQYFTTKIELTPRFIKLRNQAFTKKERDIIRLALIKQLIEYTKEQFKPERIQELELLIQKFNDGKHFK